MQDALELGYPIPYDIEADEVRLAKQRDAAVWSSWYDRYFPVLYRYVFARCGRSEDAEDIASQAFVKAIEHIDRFKYHGKPVLAWLYRITHNLLTDRLRKEKRRSMVPLEAVVIEMDSSDQTETRVHLNDALGRLKAEQREIILLRYIVALSVPEIAAMLGKSEAAVYSTHVRAIGNLRKALKA